VISISYNDNLGKVLTDFAQKFPEFFPKAMRDVGSHLRKRMAQELRAGAPAGEALAPPDPLTIALKASSDSFAKDYRRRKLGKKSHPKPPTPVRLQRLTRTFGGKLPDLLEYQLGGGELLRVGFLGVVFGGSQRAAQKFQSEMTRPFTRIERQMIRLKLGQDYKQPKEYDRPARPVIPPYEDDPTLKADIIDTVAKSITAQMENSIRKAGAA